MNYLVLELHGGLDYAAIVTNEDGENKVFDTLEAAQKEADDCQDGIIVPLNDAGLPPKPEPEQRVYVVNADDTDFHSLSDNEIADHCETSGQIYSLEFFEEQINNEELDLSNSFIRIMEPPVLDDRSEFDKMENAPYEDS